MITIEVRKAVILGEKGGGGSMIGKGHNGYF